MSIKEDLMKASEIISSAASKSEEDKETKENEEDKKEPVKEPENENTGTAPESEPAVAEKQAGKINIPALALGIACAVELVIIALLLIF